jgi:hypothetical protein
MQNKSKSHFEQRGDTTGITVGADNASQSSDDRSRMISEAAYYIAQKRNYQRGDSIQDWLHAELAIEREMSRRGGRATFLRSQRAL